MGAQVHQIVRHLTKDFLLLTILANILAWPIAWIIMQHWIQSFAYHIQLHFWIFLSAGAVAILIGLLTVITQSIRAAHMNPVKSLLDE